MKSIYRKLGNYIQAINIRNKELKVERLLGVSIKKILMPSIANTVGTNMKTYKIIKRNQFAYGSVTSRNGDKISIALLEEFEEAIISQAYTVFEVIDTNELNPEYLMMWFRRPEFDRYARFMSHGSARETFDWDEMLEVELPIPTIEKQREIVKEYNTIVNRIKLNEQLNKKLEATAQALYKHWFVEFEFPIDLCQSEPVEDQEVDYSKGYKSSGGKMVFNAELEKEIPEGWGVNRLDMFGEIIDSLHKTPVYSEKGYSMVRVTDIKGRFLNLRDTLKVSEKIYLEFTKKYKPIKGDILMSRVGTYGVSVYVGTNEQFCLGQNTLVINPKNVSGAWLFLTLIDSSTNEQIEEQVTGSTQKTISLKSIRALKYPLPDENWRIIEKFTSLIKPNFNLGIIKGRESEFLHEMKNLLLSKMTKVELEKEITM